MLSLAASYQQYLLLPLLVYSEQQQVVMWCGEAGLWTEQDVKTQVSMVTRGPGPVRRMEGGGEQLTAE